MVDRMDKPQRAGKLGLAVTVAVALLAAAALIWVPWYQINQDLAQDRLQPGDVPEQVDRYRRTWAQIFGGAAVLLGLYFTYRRIRSTERNVEIAREGQITERFTRAIEQLGDERLAVRLGGIYALERIARDSEKDHWTVMEVLTAFVRESASPPEKVASDVQAALTVIGRRSTAYDSEEHTLDLGGVSIPRANLTETNLSGAKLRGADLTGAMLVRANFTCVELMEASLRRANLRWVDLTEANLAAADLAEADLTEADLSGASLFASKLHRADFFGANLTGVNLVGADLPEADLTDATYELEQLAAAAFVEGIKGLSDEELAELERLRQASDEGGQQPREEGDSQ